MRKKFKMYKDWLPMIEAMTPEGRGELMSVIFKYQCGEDIPEDTSEEVRVAFACMKPRFDRDMKKDRSGENHWNWKGGITDENKADRNCAEYKEFRRAVLERDHYTCQICGQVGGKLNVHHIKHFSDNKDLRFDPDNGITLCEKCHKEVHKRERQHDIL